MRTATIALIAEPNSNIFFESIENREPEFLGPAPLDLDYDFCFEATR